MKRSVRPPAKCDVCEKPIIDRFYDAFLNAQPRAAWGYACPKCFMRYGVGLGPGSGQEFSKAEDGKFYKTKG